MVELGKVTRCLVACALALSGASRAGAQSRQSLDDAWWTGPMLAPGASTLPRGHFLIEPYLYDVNAGGSNTYGSLTYLMYGLANGLSIGASPVAGLATVGGGTSSSRIGLGDVGAIVQARLTQFHPGGWVPTLSFNVTETLPTGRYDRLGDHPGDGLGGGAYVTTLSLYSQTYFWMPNGRILRMRLNVSQAFSGRAAVRGVSVYGTDGAFRGSASPGSAAIVDLSWEYSLTRRWVLALEFNDRAQEGTHVRGVERSDDSAAPLPVRLDGPASNAFAIAPAVEYSWTPNIGVLLALRVIPAGHNTPRSVTPAVAINVVR